MKVRPLAEGQFNAVKENLARHINQVAGRTAIPGSVTRLAFSNEETQALKYLEAEGAGLGLDTAFDAFGNLHCKLIGRDPGLPIVMFGSHVDSVYNAGRFDGVASIAAGLESLRLVREINLLPQRTLELIAFRGEESTRFDKALLGSSLLLGKLARPALDKSSLGDKKTIAEAMAGQGLRPDLAGIVKYDIAHVLAFLELHIEQSSLLYQKHLPLGIVSVIASPERYKVTATGESLHSGTTAMRERHDPVVAAGAFAAQVRGLARRASKHGRHPVATIGDIHSAGGSMNQTAESVVMKLDIRSIVEAERQGLAQKIKERAERIGQREGVTFKFESQGQGSPVRTDPFLVKLLRNITRGLGYRAKVTPSFAGHDAMNFAQAGVPTAMIFVQSKDGMSHNPKEFSEIEDIARGTVVLFNAVAHLAQEQ